ncbi:MAG: BPL-N domain-containing protein [Rhabdochlamydiaceae bacterium]|nr:BPL-N domain-containing protein [Candidatus Amphrikana amoebophyrae]
MNILIYKGEGVSPLSLKKTALMAKVWDPSAQVTLVNSTHLGLTGWMKNASTIIFPGGRDIPYHNALKGAANQNIRQFVEEGGLYIGICAGGYYGSSKIEFESGFQNEVIAERELKFFPGKAIGTLFNPGTYVYDSEHAACDATVSFHGESHQIYYNGGCYFEKANSFDKVQVLAHYDDHPSKPAAIIECKVGKGRAILSGVHFEFSPKEIYAKILK